MKSNKKVIGKVVLGKNRLGWTDYSNQIVLTFKNREAKVYEGQNLFLIESAASRGIIEFIKFDEPMADK